MLQVFAFYKNSRLVGYANLTLIAQLYLSSVIFCTSSSFALPILFKLFACVVPRLFLVIMFVCTDVTPEMGKHFQQKHIQSNPVNCIVNLPSLFMRLNELCVYAKVQIPLIFLLDVRRWSRVKTSTRKTLTFIVYSDHSFIQARKRWKHAFLHLCF